MSQSLIIASNSSYKSSFLPLGLASCDKVVAHLCIQYVGLVPVHIYIPDKLEGLMSYIVLRQYAVLCFGGENTTYKELAGVTRYNTLY